MQNISSKMDSQKVKNILTYALVGLVAINFAISLMVNAEINKVIKEQIGDSSSKKDSETKTNNK